MEIGEALANKLEPALQGGGTRINASSFANSFNWASVSSETVIVILGI
jgi:hypothetical protein